MTTARISIRAYLDLDPKPAAVWAEGEKVLAVGRFPQSTHWGYLSLPGSRIRLYWLDRPVLALAADDEPTYAELAAENRELRARLEQIERDQAIQDLHAERVPTAELAALRRDSSLLRRFAALWSEMAGLTAGKEGLYAPSV